MPAQGKADANSAVTNSYRLEIVGLPDIFFTRVGELERKLIMVDMPDQTKQVSGQVSSGEFDADQLAHHEGERAALEALLTLSASGTLGHKTVGTMFYLRADGTVVLSVMLDGLICMGRKLPEMNAQDDGEKVVITWSFTYDDLIFL